jgi:hypothetical protein
MCDLVFQMGCFQIRSLYRFSTWIVRLLVTMLDFKYNVYGSGSLQKSNIRQICSEYQYPLPTDVEYQSAKFFAAPLC